MILKQGERFEDEYGYFYLLGEKIGEGGQGATYKIEGDEDLALKIAIRHNSTEQATDSEEEDAAMTVVNEEPTEIDQLKNRLHKVRLLPIPKDLIISRPLCFLKNGAGYLMTFMGGMEPFSKFNKKIHSKESSDYPCFKLDKDGKPTDDADHFLSYIASGGTRKRLYALGKAAIALGELHSQGLVFGDVSEGNIMFSSDKSHVRIGLIDVDNICFESKAGDSSVYTPGLGAPEIVAGTSCANSMADSYAFAVMAFRLLTLLHPFEDGENQVENAWSQQSLGEDVVTLVEKPWIYDRNDDSNKAKENKVQVYVPLAMTMNDLFELFHNTFSKGLNKPIYRTPISKWAPSFIKAADKMIVCPKCKMSYFYDYKDSDTGREGCPWCDEKNPDYIIAKSYFVSVSGVSKQSRWDFCREIEDRSSVILPKRMFTPFSTFDCDEDCISVYRKTDELIFKNLSEFVDIFIATDEKKDFVKITRHHQFKLISGKPFYLFTTDKKTKRSTLVVLSFEGGKK